MRGDGGAAAVRREALWREEQLLEGNASLVLWLWWWWLLVVLLLSRATEGVLAVATAVELAFLRCGGTYDIVLALPGREKGLMGEG